MNITLGDRMMMQAGMFDFSKLRNDEDTGLSDIIFQQDEEGNIWAIRNRKIIGLVHPFEAKTPGRNDEDEWITIKGTHVLIDDETKEIKKGPDRLKALSKTEKSTVNSSGKELRSELQPKVSDCDFSLDYDMDEFIHKNIGNRKNPKSLYNFYHEVEDNGGDGPQAVEDEYYKLRLGACNQDLHEITKDEADEILYDNLSSGVVQLWFREYDHEIKDTLVKQMTQSPEVHNAALNIMYGNYKYYCQSEGTEPLSYEEFLVTPVKMYRGGSGKEYDQASVFSSYTFDREVAGTFTAGPVGQGHKEDPNGVVWEAEIRPIDTYGSVFTNGESEILVPKQIAPNGNRDSAEEVENSLRLDNTKLMTAQELGDAFSKLGGNRYFRKNSLDNAGSHVNVTSKENQ